VLRGNSGEDGLRRLEVQRSADDCTGTAMKELHVMGTLSLTIDFGKLFRVFEVRRAVLSLSCAQLYVSEEENDVPLSLSRLVC